jgi:ABC-type multidrug transport system permease subunit
MKKNFNNILVYIGVSIFYILTLMMIFILAILSIIVGLFEMIITLLDNLSSTTSLKIEILKGKLK